MGKVQEDVLEKILLQNAKTRELKRNIGRPKRFPVGHRMALAAPEIPGFRVRWANMVGNRIGALKEAGYESVMAKEGEVYGEERLKDGSQIGTPVTKNVGGGMKAMLMKLPTEEHEAQAAYKEEQIAEREETRRIPNQDLRQVGDVQVISHKVKKEN